MKRTLIFGLALLLSSAAFPQNTYTINGTIHGIDINGEPAELSRIEGKTLVQQTAIRNNKFMFTGSVDKPELWILFIENHRIPFVIENADISIKIYPDSTRISGTKTNDDFQQFIDKSNAYKKQITEVYNKHQAAIDSPEERERLENLYQEMEKSWQSQVASFVKENINNPAGQNALQSMVGSLSLGELKAIITKVDSTNLHNKPVQNAIDRIEVMEKTAIGQFYTDIQAFTPSSERIALSDYAVKNKYIVLHFWASWCAPCRQNMPELVSVYDKYKNHGLEIVSLSIENDKNQWTRAINELGMNWPQMSDLSGWDSRNLKAYDITAIPQLILIDKEGYIINKTYNLSDIEKQLEDLL